MRTQLGRTALLFLSSGIWEGVTELCGDESGQTIVEYAMIIVLVALGVLLASPNLASAVVQVFAETSSLLTKRPA